jgi:LacI family transcriptional regulator
VREVDYTSRKGEERPDLPDAIRTLRRLSYIPTSVDGLCLCRSKPAPQCPNQSRPKHTRPRSNGYCLVKLTTPTNFSQTSGGRSEKSGLILAELRKRIETGTLAPGQSLPSERVLAEEFGVSRAVVQATVKELERSGLLDCTPNCRPKIQIRDGRQVLKARRGRDQIAVWIHPNLEDIGAATILQGVQTSLGAAGYKALVACAQSSPKACGREENGAYLDSLIATPSVAGAIIWHSGEEHLDATYQAIIEAGLPVVFVDREPPEPIVADVVSSNNRRAARQAVRHLIELGHERIAMVSNDEGVSTVRDRVIGYRQALEEASIPFRSDYLVCAHHPLREGGDLVAASLLALSQPPTAVFAVNDQTAMGLFDAFKKLGIAIPEKLSLIGFDWYMRWMPSGGHISTVCQQFDEIGRVAAERVLARIAGTAESTPCTFLLDAPLVLRDTTGPKR